jgi:lipopolysaccharide transport system ATP-binding protein
VTYTAVQVSGLSKQYRIGKAEPAYRTFREDLVRRARAAFRPSPAADDAPSIWALRDVSFAVEAGEVVGVIGRNGAGKSTLLKVLSRITRPTEGRVEVRGRVASLLEVGTGFHAELTGRENVFLNAAILGMRRGEIVRKFDDIVAFAEVGPFVDTPVKHYSSGMYLRLAFAVAAHLDPHVLLLDEVLAVGDAAFQKKCLGKMGEVARSGRTVLFVSHNLAAVRALCVRCVYLEQGRVRAAGPTEEVLDLYTRTGALGASVRWTRPADAAEDRGAARLLAVSLVDRTEPVVAADEPLRVAVEFATGGGPVIPGIHFLNGEGTILFSSADWSADDLPAGTYRSVCLVPPLLLPGGMITVSAYLYDSARPGTNELPRDWIREALTFDLDDAPWIEHTRRRWLRPWPGAVRPRLEWKLERTT